MRAFAIAGGKITPNSSLAPVSLIFQEVRDKREAWDRQAGRQAERHYLRQDMMSHISTDGKRRCFAGTPGKEFYTDYHDHEWGVPVHDDRALLEMLILEGMQAGLSWETILKRREAYRRAFHAFDPVRVASMSDEELDALCHSAEIIRHRLKIYAARKNARVFLEIQKEFGSFSHYLWSFVDNKPIVNRWQKREEKPALSKESIALSKDLKKRGMSFTGPTIMYAYMQAVGLVNDHMADCWKTA